VQHGSREEIDNAIRNAEVIKFDTESQSFNSSTGLRLLSFLIVGLKLVL